MVDTPISVIPQTFPSQPQTFLTYVGGPLNGQQVPLTTGPTPHTTGDGCILPGTAIPWPCSWGGVPNAPPGTQAGPHDVTPFPIIGTPNDPTTGPTVKAASNLDLVQWLKDIFTKDNAKGVGLVLLAVLIGTLGILIFAFAPTSSGQVQGLTRTAIKAAV